MQFSTYSSQNDAIQSLFWAAAVECLIAALVPKSRILSLYTAETVFLGVMFFLCEKPFYGMM